MFRPFVIHVLFCFFGVFLLHFSNNLGKFEYYDVITVAEIEVPSAHEIIQVNIFEFLKRLKGNILQRLKMMGTKTIYI